MRKALLSGLMLLAASFAHAQCSIQLDRASAYIDVNAAVVVDGVSYQPSFTCTDGEWTAGTWLNHSDGSWWDPTSEVDIFTQRSWQLRKTRLTTGVQAYFIPQATDLLNFYGIVNRRFENGFSLYGKFEYFTERTGELTELGELIRIGVSYKRPLSGMLVWGVDANGYHDTGTFGFDSGELGFVETNLTLALWRNTSAYVRAMYHMPFGVDDTRENRFVSIVGIAHTF